MLSLRKETDYALQFLKHLQKAKGNYVSLMCVAKDTGVSFLFLQKIARKLRLGRIIKSEQGTSGGYKLNLNPKKLTLKKIVEVVEGGCALTACGGNKKCAREGCLLRKKAVSINKKILKLLEGITLASW